MSVLIIVTTSIKGENVEKAREAFAQLLPDTREFEGCEGVNLHVAQDDGTVLIVEQWTSKEAYEKYFAWRMSRPQDAELLGDLFDAPPVTRYFDPLDA